MSNFESEFLPNLKPATVTYAGWRKNFAKTEVPKWDAYLELVLAHEKGEPAPAAPVFKSKFGNMLLAAAEQHVSVTDLGSVWQPQPTPDPTITTNITNGDHLTMPFTWTATCTPAPESVEFWVDGTLMATDDVAPYSYTLNLSAGSHVLGLCAWLNGVKTCVSPAAGETGFARITAVTTAATYRFATYNTTTDRITGCLNRFVGSPGWWVPGTAEGTPWPSGGGIFPTTHATYGPGFRFVTTDEMLYVAGSGINCRNAVDTSSQYFGTDTALRLPVAGSLHTWEGTYMHPSGYTWPAGEQHESLWEMFATHNGFDAVYHHLFISNGAWASGFKYYFAHQYLTPTASPPPTSLWNRYVCPYEWNENEYHTIRWAILWSSPGVANGYIKCWTSINGGAFNQWLDLTNIVTKLSSFQTSYGAAQCGLRAPLGGGPISFHAHNLRVTIT